MRRTFLMLAIDIVQLMRATGATGAQKTSFFDDFQDFDATRWSEDDHELGPSNLTSDNVGVRRETCGSRFRPAPDRAVRSSPTASTATVPTRPG